MPPSPSDHIILLEIQLIVPKNAGNLHHSRLQTPHHSPGRFLRYSVSKVTIISLSLGPSVRLAGRFKEENYGGAQDRTNLLWDHSQILISWTTSQWLLQDHPPNQCWTRWIMSTCWEYHVYTSHTSNPYQWAHCYKLPPHMGAQKMA